MLKNLTMQYQRIYFRGKLTNIQELFKQKLFLFKLSFMYFKQKAIWIHIFASLKTQNPPGFQKLGSKNNSVVDYYSGRAVFVKKWIWVRQLMLCQCKCSSQIQYVMLDGEWFIKYYQCTKWSQTRRSFFPCVQCCICIDNVIKFKDWMSNPGCRYGQMGICR